MVGKKLFKVFLKFWEFLGQLKFLIVFQKKIDVEQEQERRFIVKEICRFKKEIVMFNIRLKEKELKEK